ncbi:MAG: hypothetical protein Q9221_008037 [Calogaya cf. arnoldii]
MAPKQHPTHSTPFSVRAESESLPALTSYLLSLISIKQSNLCVSADVHSTSSLFRLAEEIGDSICVLKTHADIIDDFSDRTIKGLQEIAKRKNFLIFEDRKLGDIGNTVQSQYTRGPLRIATWAHLTNAHIFPGPAIIPALQSAANSTLVSLNQSVSTEITTGTPRTSIDGLSTTGTDPDPEPELDPFPSSSSSAPFQYRPSSTNTQNTLSPTTAEFDMSHRRSSVVTATTTISQTFEPCPPNPATLHRSLSSSSGDKPLDRATALKELGPPPHARGLLLLAQMSSENNLFTAEYTDACTSAAREHSDFVLGFIAQENLNADKTDEFLVFTPGVGFPPEGKDGMGENNKGDGMGQRWRGPREVVRDEGADVVIVGRGVVNAKDRASEAERYRREAWRGCEERVERKK